MSDAKRPASDAFHTEDGNDDSIKAHIRKVKNRIIDTSKLIEIFKTVETEKQQAIAEAEAAKARLSENALGPSTQGVSHTLEKKIQQLAEARKDADESKSKIKVLEESLADMTRRKNATDMLNMQLTEKAKSTNNLETELGEVKKNLNKATKEREQANRKLSEARETVMKMNAEKISQRKLLEEHRQYWEEEHHTQTNELQKRIKTLEDELEELKDLDRGEDMMVDFLEVQIMKEELTEAKSELQQKADELKTKTNDLKAAQDRLRELQETIHHLEQNHVDSFEEVDSGHHSGPAVQDNTVCPPSIPEPKSAEPTILPPQKVVNAVTTALPETILENTEAGERRSPQSRADVSNISRDQLNTALGALEDLKAQFSVLRWIHGHKNTAQRIAALESQVMQLTKEKNALQEELLRHLMAPKPHLVPPQVAPWDPDHFRRSSFSLQNAPPQPHLQSAASSSQQIPKSIEIPRQLATRSMTAAPSIQHQATAAPTPQDSIATLKKRGRKPKAVQPSKEPIVDDNPMEVDYVQEDSSEAGPSQTLSVVPTPGKPPRKMSVSTKAAPIKPRVSRKSVKPKVDFSQIQIRNISVNPFIPCISNPDIYFSVLMNTSIFDDSQPNTKLSTIETVLPQKLDTLFAVVRVKAKEIVNTVMTFREIRNVRNDDTRQWTLEGLAPITTSESLSPNESYIVQLLCVLEAYFSQMDIYSKFFADMYETILRDSMVDDFLECTIVLVRVTTGVCRAQGDMKRARILAYDLLREVPKRKQSIAFCEAMASIWPAVFVAPSNLEPQDPQFLVVKTFQAIVGTIQDDLNKESVPLAFGYETFVDKCQWPVLDNAPYVDELVDELMNSIHELDYAQKCQSTPGLAFAHRKALELLFVQGFDWIEVYNNYIKPDLIKMMTEPDRHAFAIPLVVAISRMLKYNDNKDNIDSTPIRTLLEGILASDAQLAHQQQAALGLVALAEGCKARLQQAKTWAMSLAQEQREALPTPLRLLL
ncbi:hypothetical protein BGX28_000849 [Mortierella sp. GBA30]|nr:hypothetical protein BGX28_000849 [Mortierella sp. GBA30]